MTYKSIPLSANTKKLHNQKFGLLTAIIPVGYAEGKSVTWLCKCECGKEKVIRGYSLTSGNSKSCGCVRLKNLIKRNTKHNMSNCPEYNAFMEMRKRCNNKNGERYSDYGGRGISIKYKDFMEFYNDVGKKPTPQHSIDRIDNDGNYEPGNCKWSTIKEQNRNSRNCVMIEFQGKTRCATEWAEEFGIKATMIRDRIKLGWSAERALTSPI